MKQKKVMGSNLYTLHPMKISKLHSKYIKKGAYSQETESRQRATDWLSAVF